MEKTQFLVRLSAAMDENSPEFRSAVDIFEKHKVTEKTSYQRAIKPIVKEILSSYFREDSYRYHSEIIGNRCFERFPILRVVFILLILVSFLPQFGGVIDTAFAQDGENESSEEITQPEYDDFSELKYYTFPVKVYGPTEGEWGEALQDALSELNKYIPVELIDIYSSPDVHVDAPASQIEVATACKTTRAVGCSSLSCIWNDVDEPPDCGSDVTLSENSMYKTATMLHELIHALGVDKHAQDPNSVMFFIENDQTELQTADLDLLWEIYPEWKPEEN